MKKIVIFYFSGTGNTWWVSEKMAHFLRNYGATVTLVSIEKTTVDKADSLIETSDIVGFGYPVYGSDLPLIMKDFMESLAPVKDKKTFIYCTQWMFSGDGARTGKDFVQKKGFDVLWGEHFFMPNNVCITLFKFLPYTNDRKKIDARLAKTLKSIEKFCKNIFMEKQQRKGFNRVSTSLGSLQRVPFRNMINDFRDLVAVDYNSCIECKKCVEICPVNNFFYDVEKKIKSAGKCILCLRCYNFCPVSAIKFMDKSHGGRKKPYQGPVENFNPTLLKY